MSHGIICSERREVQHHRLLRGGHGALRVGRREGRPAEPGALRHRGAQALGGGAGRRGEHGEQRQRVDRAEHPAAAGHGAGQARDAAGERRL